MTDHEKATPRPLHEAGDLVMFVTGGERNTGERPTRRIETFRVTLRHARKSGDGYTVRLVLRPEPSS